MSDYNRVILMGHLAADPETRTTSSGTTITSFTVAANRKSSTAVDEVCFAPVTAFGRQGELVAAHFRKGSPILVEGRMRTESWKNDRGEKRSKLALVCESFSFVGPRQAETAGAAEMQDEFDIPF